jgi:hypothetical protein
MAANENVFMKKGEFGTRPPELLLKNSKKLINSQLLQNIPSAGTNVD